MRAFGRGSMKRLSSRLVHACSGTAEIPLYTVLRARAGSLAVSSEACARPSTDALGGYWNTTGQVYVGHPDEVSACTCIATCTQSTELDNTRASYFCVGCFFGVWCVTSMLNARIKE